MKSKDIAKKFMWAILTFFAFLEYFSAFRPYFEENLGIYVLGFVDGAVAISTSLVAVFYIASFLEGKPKITRPAALKREAVKPEFIEEMIERCEILKKVVDQVAERSKGHISVFLTGMHIHYVWLYRTSSRVPISRTNNNNNTSPHYSLRRHHSLGNLRRILEQRLVG